MDPEAEEVKTRWSLLLALTAYAKESDRQKCFKPGMDEYLAKPLRRKQFVNYVLRLVDSN